MTGEIPVETGAAFEVVGGDLEGRKLVFEEWTEDREGRKMALFSPTDAEWGLPLYPPAVINHLDTTWEVVEE